MSILQADISTLTLPDLKQNRIVYVDGVHSTEFSGVVDNAPGFRVDYFTQDGENGLRLTIPDMAVLEHPVHLLLISSERPLREVFGVHLKVDAGRSTRLKLIVNQVDLGDGRYEAHFSSEVNLSAGACVKMSHLRRGGGNSKRMAKNRFFLGNHSDLEHFSFTEGGLFTSSDSVAEFNGEHAFASFKGLSALHGSSAVQDRLIADHKAPYGTSRQVYKNILMGNSRSQFDSLVVVQKGAVRSDSRQLNKNLLLSESARAEARPELRIDNDDVSAAHGATVGQIDKSELFYLRSRGLSERLARFVMTLGFAEEILDDIEPLELKADIRALVKAELKAALAFDEKGA